jgi:hypothetical protein
MMNSKTSEKHKQQFPSARAIRRACSRELYRSAKRLKSRVSPDQMKQAEELYVKEVLLHLPYIVENGSNRKALAAWWAEHVCPSIAPIWNVEEATLNQAFRDAFGG